METINDLIKDKKKAEDEIAEIMSKLCDKYPNGKFKLYYFVGEKSEVEGLAYYESQTRIIVEL